MFTVSCTRRHCRRRPQRCGEAPRGGGNLARNYYATSSMPRTRTATETGGPEKEIAKKKNHSARARTLTSPKGSTCRDVQKIEVIVARGVGGQINPSNSSTFHIPPSKLHLVLRVSLMGAHQFGEGLTSNASLSSETSWAIKPICHPGSKMFPTVEQLRSRVFRQ